MKSKLKLSSFWLPLQAVDAVTAECLALRDQVAVYEEQLANMETQHKMVRQINQLKKKNIWNEKLFLWWQSPTFSWFAESNATFTQQANATLIRFFSTILNLSTPKNRIFATPIYGNNLDLIVSKAPRVWTVMSHFYGVIFLP